MATPAPKPLFQNVFIMCLQHFSGLPVTLAGPVTHHFVAGHQRTQAPGGKSSPAVPRL